MNPPTTTRHAPYPPERLRAATGDIAHLPGHDGLPLLGSTLEYFSDQEAWSVHQHRRYGRVWRSNVLFHRSVVFQSAEAAEALLLDREKNFSSILGWSQHLWRYFAGGLMLRDFDDHRLHRRLLQSAFTRAAVEGYVARMNPLVAQALARWPTGPARFYPLVKRLLLDQAAEVFLGIALGADAERVLDAFTALTLGVVALVPYEVPGLARWRAARSREYLVGYLRGLIPARRARDDGDMFSRLCRDAHEEGGRLTDDEVVDHMIFLLMAAHDTTTSALTTLVEALGRHPDWQERLRDEARALDVETLGYADFDRLPLVDLCLREALRLYPPVPTLPRRTLRACTVDGVAVPADTSVWIDNYFIHRDPRHWSRPDAFDPERFSDARAEHKAHRFCFIPFGAGAHTCLGMQFATMQSKLVLYHLLRRFRWRLPAKPAGRRQMIPFPKPADELALVFERA